MLLKIILNQEMVSLEIEKDGRVLAKTNWQSDFSLSERLLIEIDNLLKKNGILVKQIEQVQAFYDEKSSVTSTRIIQTVTDAWNLKI